MIQLIVQVKTPAAVLLDHNRKDRAFTGISPQGVRIVITCSRGHLILHLFSFGVQIGKTTRVSGQPNSELRRRPILVCSNRIIVRGKQA